MKTAIILYHVHHYFTSEVLPTQAVGPEEQAWIILHHKLIEVVFIYFYFLIVFFLSCPKLFVNILYFYTNNYISLFFVKTFLNVLSYESLFHVLMLLRRWCVCVCVCVDREKICESLLSTKSCVSLLII